MILFDSLILRLNYSPATDILMADLSNEHRFNERELEEALAIIIEHVRHYDIKCLLMDSRKRILLMDEQRYGDMMSGFAKELHATRLLKLARIQTNIAMRESIVQILDTQIISGYAFRTFLNIDEAMAWLTLKA